MEIINTQWAFESSLEMLEARVFIKKEYDEVIQPDVLLLKNFPRHEKLPTVNFGDWQACADKLLNTVSR